MTKAIIVDLDGTLCDHSHRQHFVMKSPKDFKSYNALMGEDKVNLVVESIIWAMIKQGHYILLVSGRHDDYRYVTTEWLNSKGIPFNSLYMRPSGDMRSDVKIKEEIWAQLIEEGYDIAFALDDRNCVVKMWRELGVPCLQVAEGDF